ncbi:MAG: M56 family metallopeptidase [Salinibacterium sp.]|nr:M56 family metallopeptidase [Salinibacterium sp.]
MIAPLALAALAIALAWPVPVLLARARWPARSPAAALVLWQAIAIAGGLSMIGALLTFGLAPFGPDLLSASVNLLTGKVDRIEFWNALALSGAVLLTAHLLLNLVLTVVRSERQRRRHEQLVRLLSSPHGAPAGARLLDSPAPVAYCLPGALGSITVVSAGLVALLDEPEMRAVIEHERAHATQRHDIVLVLFRAWHASLPWFPIAFRAQREVGMLVEMLADDTARRSVPDSVLARAIVLVGAGQDRPVAEPVVAVEEGGGASVTELSSRLARLEVPPLSRPAETAAVAAAVALLAVPTALLAAPVLAALQ